jgi:BASS family bile acid:Na+ symporter
MICVREHTMIFLFINREILFFRDTMTKNVPPTSVYKIVLSIAVGLLTTGTMLFFYQETIAAGFLLIGGFALLACAFKGFPLVSGFSYTFWILAAVTTSLYYPQFFRGFGTFSFKLLIIPLLQLIMFGVGSTMGIKDFEGVVKMPKGVVVGLVCHFVFMPLIGYTVARSFGFPPEIGAGIILVGSVPCGLASNVMSYLANANVALSVTLSAVGTVLAPVTTPFLMRLLAGQAVSIDVLAMMWDITKIVLIPVSGGLLYNYFLHGRFPWLDKFMPKLSMLSIGAIIVVITAAGRDSLLLVGPLLVLACLVHNVSGYILGYVSCRALRMDERTCRTIALEVGLQNAGLASGLALQMGGVATVGLAPAIFGPLMNVTGSSLATWWHGRPPKETPTV